MKHTHRYPRCHRSARRKSLSKGFYTLNLFLRAKQMRKKQVKKVRKCLFYSWSLVDRFCLNNG